MEVADLTDLVVMQERGAVAGLSNVFPQETYPFPRVAVRERWKEELQDQTIAAYVATSPDARLMGFAARRGDEVLHFGTALETWGSGLATWMHDALIETYPPICYESASASSPATVGPDGSTKSLGGGRPARSPARRSHHIRLSSNTSSTAPARAGQDELHGLQHHG